MTDNTDMFEFVKKRLDESRGKLPTVAEGSGVGYETIKAIVYGKHESPRYKTVKALYEYFVACDGVV